MKRTLSSFLLLLFLLPLTSCGVMGSRFSHALRGEEEYIMHEERFDQSIENISVNWKSGDVMISLWDGEDIIVREQSATTLSSRTEFRADEEDNSLSVSFSAKGVWMLPFVFKKDLEILIPRNTKLKRIEVDNVSASLKMRDLSAMSVNVSTVSGRIDAEEMGVIGELKAKTTSGDITFAGKALSSLTLSSISGGISAQVENEVRDASFNTTSGHISAFLRRTERTNAKSVSGTVDLRVEDSPEYIEAVSTSGNVSLKLNEEIRGFMMTASSLSGTVRCDFPSSVIGDQYVYGDQSTKIKLKTTSGRIHTRKS